MYLAAETLRVRALLGIADWNLFSNQKHQERHDLLLMAEGTQDINLFFQSRMKRRVMDCLDGF